MSSSVLLPSSNLFSPVSRSLSLSALATRPLEHSSGECWGVANIPTTKAIYLHYLSPVAICLQRKKNHGSTLRRRDFIRCPVSASLRVYCYPKPDPFEPATASCHKKIRILQRIVQSTNVAASGNPVPADALDTDGCLPPIHGRLLAAECQAGLHGGIRAKNRRGHPPTRGNYHRHEYGVVDRFCTGQVEATTQNEGMRTARGS